MTSVSLVLFTYNHSKFIKECIHSILEQDCEPFELIISDDCSTDSNFAVIQKVVDGYDGPHQIKAFQNERNLGGDHVDVAAKRASGEFLIFCHGDDISKPNRVRRILEVYHEFKPTLINHNTTFIDDKGEALGIYNPDHQSGFVDSKEVIKGWDKRFLAAGFACHRDLFWKFNPITIERMGQAGDDHIFPFRAVLLNGFYYIDESLLYYRRHENNWGEKLVDHSQSKQIAVEGRGANRVMAEMFMLDDVEHLIAAEDDDRLLAIREQLKIKIFASTRQWIKKRNNLIAKQLRPTWMPREEFEKRKVSDVNRFENSVFKGRKKRKNKKDRKKSKKTFFKKMRFWVRSRLNVLRG